MADYSFQTLNDKEFENLCRDLLQHELKITLESFKSGRDGGIDLRYSTPTEKRKIIVQAKHWSKSGFKKLLSHLRKSELPKIKKLKPERYIVVTSVELSPGNKNEILTALSPFVIGTSDIYGKDDLNNLLGKYPQVEDGHLKLWLSSSRIFRNIMNNGLRGRSEFAASNIEKSIRLYVPNDKYSAALNILNKERFLIIIGEPGIGKTVLAKMILFNLLGIGYKLVSVDEKISESEPLWESGVKQVFYFDDFLGANYLEVSQPKNSDSALINFIKRIKDDPEKRLILTCRTTILNQATQKLPKLQDPYVDLSKHEVNIKDYSEWNKALILYNHLFFSELQPGYIENLLDEKGYWKIIKHKNYNPRVIEFITNPLRLQNIPADKYLEFILEKLDNPSLIWEDPYENQIDEYARFLIGTLFSIETGKEATIRAAFDARLDYEIRNGGFQRLGNIFHLKIKELLGGFIVSKRDGDAISYGFFNPSIVDFLINYYNKNVDEKWRIIESAIYIEQFLFRFDNPLVHSLKFTDEELPRLREIIFSKENHLTSNKSGALELELLNLYCSLFHIDDVREKIIELLEKLNVQNVVPRQFSSLVRLLEEFYFYSWAKDIVVREWKSYIDQLFVMSTSQEDFDYIWGLFEQYDENYESYIKNTESEGIVRDALDQFWQQRVDEIRWGGDEVSGYTSSVSIDDHLSNVYSDGVRFNEKFGINELPSLEKLLEMDTEEMADSNRVAAAEESYIDEDSFKEQHHLEKEEASRVNDLFAR